MAQEQLSTEASGAAQAAKREHALGAAVTAGPAAVWILVFLLLPLAAIGVISFLSRGEYGEISVAFTLENYKRLLGFGLLGFDPLYPAVFIRSILLGGMTAGLCLICGLPLAFFISRLRANWKTAALTLVVIPFWTNLLIRTYAWQILLSSDGWLSRAAAALGLCPNGTALYPGLFAVLVGMVCDFLPFMVLPLYASVEKIDWHLAEAAMDLGADRIRVFWHAVLPQITPGLAAGTLLVFLPATGQFVIPDLLGGAKTVMLGNVVQQQFGPSRDWPFGAAIAMAALGLVVLGIVFWVRKERGQEAPFLQARI